MRKASDENLLLVTKLNRAARVNVLVRLADGAQLHSGDDGGVGQVAGMLGDVRPAACGDRIIKKLDLVKQLRGGCCATQTHAHPRPPTPTPAPHPPTHTPTNTHQHTH